MTINEKCKIHNICCKPVKYGLLWSIFRTYIFIIFTITGGRAPKANIISKYPFCVWDVSIYYTQTRCNDLEAAISE